MPRTVGNAATSARTGSAASSSDVGGPQRQMTSPGSSRASPSVPHDVFMGTVAGIDRPGPT